MNPGCQGEGKQWQCLDCALYRIWGPAAREKRRSNFHLSDMDDEAVARIYTSYEREYWIRFYIMLLVDIYLKNRVRKRERERSSLTGPLPKFSQLP